ncbi:hypothetical protein [Streptomyces sp. NPDC050738]|uniref:hypothetical protein n=1 Tax=Streptomyces sp. NPDC050738 TaxID=3154744 RepID=UPI00343A0372
MAAANFSAAPSPAHASPHPLANPGYGKRSAPDQLAREATDFAHLPAREAAIAAYVDRLPDGADISVKTLAKHLPYGQCALRTALNTIQRAGHLRRGREHIAGSGSARWVTRTWFSRTPRDDAWWAVFATGDQPKSPQHPTRSRAFILLAALGRSAPSLSLSARDCHDLEPLADRWFAHGATEAEILRALVAGLPAVVHRAAGLVRRRLTDQLPPERPAAPSAPSTPRVLRVLECAKCGTPARPEALPGGECAPCRGEQPPPPATAPLPAAAVHAYATQARAAAAVRTTEGTRT